MNRTITRSVVAAVAALGMAVAITACEPTTSTVSADAPVVAQGAEPADADYDNSLSSSQRNAIAKAESYLDYTAFSRSGLIEQLEFEGFDTADATFAVDQLDVDWNEQAVKKAKDYMGYSAFSEQSLTEQLEFEGFTPEQARYGAASQF